jgi:murein L,D-transpeptidase YafK
MTPSARFAVYPICRWSAGWAPSWSKGDAQAPEGFYTVDAKALNPASRWHRSFNLGFPNAYDRSHQRTGSLLMVHGGCSSIGCYAMTDPVVDEIWRLVTAASAKASSASRCRFSRFRMTAENMAQGRTSAGCRSGRTSNAVTTCSSKRVCRHAFSACKGSYSFAAAPARSDGSHEIDNLCMDLTNPKVDVLRLSIAMFR